MSQFSFLSGIIVVNCMAGPELLKMEPLDTKVKQQYLETQMEWTQYNGHLNLQILTSLIGLHTVAICTGHTAPIDGYGTRTGVTSTMVKAVTIDRVREACTTRQLTAIDSHIYGCRHVTVMHRLRMSIFHLYELPQVAPHPHFLTAGFGHLMHCAMCLRFIVADSDDITVRAVL